MHKGVPAARKHRHSAAEERLSLIEDPNRPAGKRNSVRASRLHPPPGNRPSARVEVELLSPGAAPFSGPRRGQGDELERHSTASGAVHRRSWLPCAAPPMQRAGRPAADEAGTAMHHSSHAVGRRVRVLTASLRREPFLSEHRAAGQETRQIVHTLLHVLSFGQFGPAALVTRDGLRRGSLSPTATASPFSEYAIHAFPVVSVVISRLRRRPRVDCRSLSHHRRTGLTSAVVGDNGAVFSTGVPGSSGRRASARFRRLPRAPETRGFACASSSRSRIGTRTKSGSPPGPPGGTTRSDASPHPSPIRDFEFTLLVLDADWVAIPVVGRSALRSRVFGPCQERLLPVHRATLTWVANGGRAPTSASRRCSVNAVQRWSSYPGSRHSGSRCRFASTSAKTLA